MVGKGGAIWFAGTIWNYHRCTTQEDKWKSRSHLRHAEQAGIRANRLIPAAASHKACSSHKGHILTGSALSRSLLPSADKYPFNSLARPSYNTTFEQAT